MHDERIHSAVNRISSLSRRSALRRLGAGGFGAGVLAGFSSRPAAAQSSFSAAATEAAARRAITAINQALATGDPAVLDAVFAPDYVNHTPQRSLATGQPLSPDLAGLKAGLLELRAVAPDAVILVRDVVASPDKAAVRVAFRGTVDPAAITLPGLANPRVHVDGVIFARFVEGRVTESWDYDDAAEILGAAAVPVTPTPVSPTPTAEVPVPEGMARETRDVRDFRAASVEGIGTLILQQDDTESLTVEAESRIIDRVETVVERGTLFIRPDRSFRTREPVTYHLTARQIDGIALSGATRLEADALATGRLELAVAGTSSARIDNLSAETVDVRMSGSGQVTLAGSVDTQTVEINATGIYDATNLVSRIASVNVGGTGQAAINVSESLDAVVGGTGRVTYVGNPQVSQDLSGLGSVTKVG